MINMMVNLNVNINANFSFTFIFAARIIDPRIDAKQRSHRCKDRCGTLWAVGAELMLASMPAIALIA